MKSIISKIGAAFVALALAGVAYAVPIQGSIGFTGTFSTDNNADFLSATSFTNFDVKTDGTATGAYAGVPELTPVTFTPFSFSDAGVVPLWAFNFAGINYSFVANTVNLIFQGANLIALEGSGTAFIDGYEESPGGYWNITANKAGASFTFSSSANVPDGATTALLLGGALVGLGVIARRRVA